MAKMNARGASEVAKIRVTKRLSEGDQVWEYRYLYALRSDGKVLGRLAGFRRKGEKRWTGGSGYSITGTVKNMADFNLEAWARGKFESQGHEVEVL